MKKKKTVQILIKMCGCALSELAVKSSLLRGLALILLGTMDFIVADIFLTCIFVKLLRVLTKCRHSTIVPFFFSNAQFKCSSSSLASLPGGLVLLILTAATKRL